MKALSPTALSRAAILRASESPRLRRLVSRHGMRAGAARFVAGETLEECLVVLARLNADGLHANTTLLGEAVKNQAGTEEVVAAYERVLAALVENGLRANVALKLTHLGLAFDEELAYRNVERLVRRAGALGTFIRIDMEQSAHVDATLRTYRRLRESGLDAVGTVLQAYLRRTEADLEDLLPLQPNLRVVKGAYLEPAPLVFPSKEEVDAQYVRLVERGLEGGPHVAVATHDERIVEHVKAWTAEHGIGRDRFEFQLLYGVRPAFQRRLAAEGYKVLVATPYGPDWYPYLMRRLAERPANVGFLLRNLLRR
jgi:proline dehydrogenase